MKPLFSGTRWKIETQEGFLNAKNVFKNSLVDLYIDNPYTGIDLSNPYMKTVAKHASCIKDWCMKHINQQNWKFFGTHDHGGYFKINCLQDIKGDRIYREYLLYIDSIGEIKAFHDAEKEIHVSYIHEDKWVTKINGELCWDQRVFSLIMNIADLIRLIIDGKGRLRRNFENEQLRVLEKPLMFIRRIDKVVGDDIDNTIKSMLMTIARENVYVENRYSNDGYIRGWYLHDGCYCYRDIRDDRFEMRYRDITIQHDGRYLRIYSEQEMLLEHDGDNRDAVTRVDTDLGPCVADAIEKSIFAVMTGIPVYPV